MPRLENKVALITGGTSGIGQATAALFAAEGAHVVITGRRADRGAAVVEGIAANGGSARFVESDVREYEDCERAVQACIDAHGRIDILFNNAGVVTFGTALTTPIEAWLNTFATNVHGLLYMSRAALPTMIQQGRGVIVNNASDWAIVGAQNALAYAATKGAVVQITRSMALDHAREGVRVNAVCPGDTYVERWRENWRLPEGKDFEGYLEELGGEFPLGRVGQVDEIARAVLFLASDESSYVTGHCLVVDGGNTISGASARF